MREHLVASGLAGRVQTTPGAVLTNCEKLLAGDPEYTFGMSDHVTATLTEVVAAVRDVCGGPSTEGDPDGPGFIDPDACIAAIGAHRDRLGRFAADGGRVLLATGHPTGLLPHYTAVARRLARCCRLLTPLDDTVLHEVDGHRLGVRFLDGVGCLWNGGDLLHTHRARYMQDLLAALEADGVRPDLVVGDHGMAGAAVEAGIPVVSIADVNDPALFLALARGRTDSVLPIDDNLAPAAFDAVTQAVLDGVG